MNLPTVISSDAGDTVNPASDAVREWPKELAGQMQAVRDVVQQAGGPVSAGQMAARFGKLRPATVRPLLDTLLALALLRQTEEGAYVS